MKIKMLTLSASADGILEQGQVVELEKEKAKELIKGGFAVEIKENVEKKEKIEVASIRPKESAVISHKKPKTK